MIETIDSKIKILLRYRDSDAVIKYSELRASICTLIEKAYFLQAIIILNKSFFEKSDNQFFTAKSAVNRHYRDWGLDEVADIYNELCTIAESYLQN
jgi:hypothetical protein